MFQPARGSTESSNEILEHRIVECLFERGALVLPPLRITADRGAVTLYGLVDSHATRRMILAIVQQVPGVRHVIDDMEIPAANDLALPASRFQYSS